MTDPMIQMLLTVFAIPLAFALMLHALIAWQEYRKHTAEPVQWFHDPVTGVQATFWFPGATPGRMPAAVVDARTERRLRESIKAEIEMLAKRASEADEVREAGKACANAARYEWLRGELQRNDPLASVTWKTNGLRHSSNWCNIPNGLQLDFLIDKARK